MALVVEPAMWDVAPGWRLVVAYGEGALSERRPGSIARELEDACARARERFGASSSGAESLAAEPAFAAWRRFLPRKERAAHESLVRRALAGKPPARIHPLVDLYNALSIAHAAPMGAWDAGELAGGELRLFRTRGGEPFTELGTSETVSAEAGEIAYGDAEMLVTRHFVWRQAERAKVGPATRRFVLVSEILPELGARAAEDVLASVLAKCPEHLDVACRGAVLAAPTDREGTVRWEWRA